MRLTTTLATFAVLAILGGCGTFQFPGLHRVEVQQGNIVTEDMVSQVREGMTRSQVRYIMGTPLIADTFNQDRWDYFYSLAKGNDLKKRQSVTVFFINDRVSRVDRNLKGKEYGDKEDKKEK